MWNNYSTNCGMADFITLFIEKVRDCFLIQHIHDVTQISGDSIGNTLDLLFTNDEEILEVVKVDIPLGRSDLACIFVSWYAGSGGCARETSLFV